jgi:hypothetical protein
MPRPVKLGASAFSVGVDDDVMHGYLYASERILEGYVPETGHDVEGVMWVTGTLTAVWAR